MPAASPATYSAALVELRMIREQLGSGRAGPADVEALIRRAATVLTDARAALQRAQDAVDVLDAATAAQPPRGGQPRKGSGLLG